MDGCEQDGQTVLPHVDLQVGCDRGCAAAFYKTKREFILENYSAMKRRALTARAGIVLSIRTTRSPRRATSSLCMI